MDLATGPVAVGALGELIAAAVAAAAGRTWKSLRASPEARAVRNAINEALAGALGDAVLPPGTFADDGWVAEVARIWRPAFTPLVSAALVQCLADPSGGSDVRFAELARRALEDGGCDFAVLGRAFWVDEFLAMLPRRMFSSLSEASLQDEGVRSLVDHLLRQRGDARAHSDAVASPGEFRQDMIALLHGLGAWARNGRLPAYLPAQADATVMSRMARVQLGIRSNPADGAAADHRGDDEDAGGSYLLPTERLQEAGPQPLWPEVAAKHRRLVVLGDPGMGKSWLIRTETHRLSRDALTRSGSDLRGVIIPIPLRCDQLADTEGQDLADKAAAYLVTERLLRSRSGTGLAARVRAGEVVLLLDALDELTTARRGLLQQLVQTWADQAGDRARCLITSRIAGYTGPPLPGATEVELLAFTSGDTVAAIKAWHLPSGAAAQLLDRARDPAVAAMARIPLLLALLCSLAADLSVGEALPKTRGQLFDRVLRWFLTRAHRSPDNSAAPPLTDIDVEALLEILAPLAFKFATEPAGWVDLMAGERLLNVIRAVGPEFTEHRRPAPEVVRELAVDAGVLVPAGDPSGGRSPGYLFFHRAVAEYLVARHLATLPEADWLTIVEEHRWFDPEWAEVIPMLGERLAPAAARKLLEHLLVVDADPFHHSLFMATRVWGARPDADQLLPVGQAEELAVRFVELIHHRTTRAAVTSHLATLGYLPRPLLTGLLEMLGDPSEQVRWAIVQALAGREGPAVTEGLLGLLDDPIHQVREAAAEALAGQEGPGITEALLGLLVHPIGDIRRDAAVALAGRKGPAVTEGLLGVLSDPDTRVGKAAAKALAVREAPGLTEALLGLLDNPDERVRLAAVGALAGREGQAVTEVLLGLLGDPDFLIREAAAEALSGREGPGVTEGLLGLLNDPHPFLQSNVVWKLRSRKEPTVTEALLDLVGATDLLAPMTAAFIPVAAATLLADREAPGLTESLLNMLGNPDTQVRAAAAMALAMPKALATRKGQAVIKGLLGLLRDPDASVRRDAAKALAGREGPGVTEGLLGLLRDPDDEDLRSAAARALAGREGPGVTQGLLGLLRDPDASVRREAAEALAGREGPGVTEGLLGLLGDPEEYVRRALAEALAGREGPGVTEGLLGLLGDPEEYVRWEAARALAGREGPGVTEALLVALLGDPDEQVRWEVVQALAVRKDVDRALLALVGETARLDRIDLVPLGRIDLVPVVNLAERLMIRNYRRLEPSEQPEIRAVMAALTATALTADSA